MEANITFYFVGMTLGRFLSGAQISYVGILAAPALFGLISQNISIWLFAPALLLMYMVMLWATLSYYKALPESER